MPSFDPSQISDLLDIIQDGLGDFSDFAGAIETLGEKIPEAFTGSADVLGTSSESLAGSTEGIDAESAPESTQALNLSTDGLNLSLDIMDSSSAPETPEVTEPTETPAADGEAETN